MAPPPSVHSLSNSKLHFLTITNLTFILKQITHRTKQAGNTQIVSGPAEIQMESRQSRKMYPSLNSEELKHQIPIFMNKKCQTTKDGVNLATKEIKYIFKKEAYISELKKKGKNTLRKILHPEKGSAAGL